MSSDRAQQVLILPANAIDLSGQTFGRLTVIRPSRRVKYSSGYATYWSCNCACGGSNEVSGCHLRSGKIASCGCAKRSSASERATTHGKSKTAEYGVWRKMRGRCESPSDARHSYYGARGINVCERWKSFEAFLADMGERPSPLHSLDRINVDGNYEPGNCRWATRKEQNRNTRRNVFITFQGEKRIVSEWAEKLGINYQTLCTRLFELRWPVAIALSPETNHPWDVAKGRRV